MAGNIRHKVLDGSRLGRLSEAINTSAKSKFVEIIGLLHGTTYEYLLQKQTALAPNEAQLIVSELVALLHDGSNGLAVVHLFQSPISEAFLLDCTKQQSAIPQLEASTGIYQTVISKQIRDFGFSQLLILESAIDGELDLKFETITQTNRRTCIISYKDGAIREFTVENKARRTGSLV